MQIDWISYGLAVLLARRQRQIKQAELAELIGISRVTLSYIERGHAHPRWKTLDAIAEVLGVQFMEYRKTEDQE